MANYTIEQYNSQPENLSEFIEYMKKKYIGVIDNENTKHKIKCEIEMYCISLLDKEIVKPSFAVDLEEFLIKNIMIEE